MVFAIDAIKTSMVLVCALYAMSVSAAGRPANCVVHRGDGTNGAPENSLEAAHRAWSR